VRDRGDVLDAGDLDAGVLDRADGGLAARARALDLHLDLAHAVLHGPAGGLLGGHLGGERGGLAGALEADVAGRRPRDDVASWSVMVTIVLLNELLMCATPVGDVLALALAGATTARLGLAITSSHLLLAGDGLLRALAGAGVGVGALTAHGQALAVAEALVGSRSRSCA
jgi:hypothetical protein